MSDNLLEAQKTAKRLYSKIGRVTAKDTPENRAFVENIKQEIHKLGDLLGDFVSLELLSAPALSYHPSEKINDVSLFPGVGVLVIPKEFKNENALNYAAPKLSFQSIVFQVAETYDIDPIELLGESRSQKISRPRQEVMYRIYTELHWSLPRIGNALKRDHTTILHGIRTHKKLLEDII